MLRGAHRTGDRLGAGPVRRSVVEGSADVHPLVQARRVGALLTLTQERGVQLGMCFLDGTNIGAHQKAAGAARETTFQRDAMIVRRLAALVAALAPRPA